MMTLAQRNWDVGRWNAAADRLQMASRSLAATGMQTGDAEQRHWLAWSLEAELAAWEILRIVGAGSAEALRAKIETSARSHGYDRILRLLLRADGAIRASTY